MLRWNAVIKYKKGPIIQESFTFEELEELHDIVERGPDFYTIESIVITINPLK